ncbi:hypothetical protein AB1A65_12450 [Muricauda sp. ANG21]|uniref:hypothetical protein n=1 Tax=Allomuricauda sp. ANG21 TaxID=3042468 RepID=UPI003452368C
MNKIVLFFLALSSIWIISCKKQQSKLNIETLTYKESEIQKKIYLMDKVRGKTHKLKSFADENREL